MQLQANILKFLDLNSSAMVMAATTTLQTDPQEVLRFKLLKIKRELDARSCVGVVERASRGQQELRERVG
jgi:hypothetical protein